MAWEAAGLATPGLSSAAARRLGSNVLEEGIQAIGRTCLNSFSADTLVMTEDGLVPIAELEVDDMVLAYDEETGEIGYYPITVIWVHEDPVIVYLTIEGETILTTPEHPFYTEEGQWVAAGELQSGDEIRQSSWDTGTVQSVHFVARPQTMYNLTVDISHTFFIGDGQWLVHNTGPCGFASGTALSALTPDRLQHASRHLTKAGLLPNWSKATGEQFVQLATNILENPTHTFDHVLQGGSAVKGFTGIVDGQRVVIFVFKTGPNAGKVATSIVPNTQQMLNWGIP
jgi:hypothetical protein